jgi:hypothetical protein
MTYTPRWRKALHNLHGHRPKCNCLVRGALGLRDKLKWIMLIYESRQSLKKSFDALPLNRDAMSLLVHIFPSHIPLWVFSHLSLSPWRAWRIMASALPTLPVHIINRETPLSCTQVIHSAALLCMHVITKDRSSIFLNYTHFTYTKNNNVCNYMHGRCLFAGACTFATRCSFGRVGIAPCSYMDFLLRKFSSEKGQERGANFTTEWEFQALKILAKEFSRSRILFSTSWVTILRDTNSY